MEEEKGHILYTLCYLPNNIHLQQLLFISCWAQYHRRRCSERRRVAVTVFKVNEVFCKLSSFQIHISSPRVNAVKLY